MVRKSPQPIATKEETLECTQQACPCCGEQMWNDYDNYRRVRTLKGVVALRLKVRRCSNGECEQYQRPYRPEAEGKWALPQQEFGLDIIACVGALRYQEHRSVPQIHQYLSDKEICVSERSVSNLLARYDELVSLVVRDPDRIGRILGKQQQAILAIDGMQPDVGHEVLWVIRECVSGEILLARTLLSATSEDLEPLLQEVKQALPIPIVGVVSDGQRSIRKAVERALPGVKHGLCQFHYLREAVKPIYEADRAAKKELKKRVRGVRAIERSLPAPDTDPLAEVAQGYCQAVRAALTDDGYPPLEASGLRLHQRLQAIDQSLEQVEKKGGCRNHSVDCSTLSRKH
jgi:hypothetical protein